MLALFCSSNKMEGLTLFDIKSRPAPDDRFALAVHLGICCQQEWGVICAGHRSVLPCRVFGSIVLPNIKKLLITVLKETLLSAS